MTIWWWFSAICTPYASIWHEFELFIKIPQNPCYHHHTITHHILYFDGSDSDPSVSFHVLQPSSSRTPRHSHQSLQQWGVMEGSLLVGYLNPNTKGYSKDRLNPGGFDHDWSIGRITKNTKLDNEQWTKDEEFYNILTFTYAGFDEIDHGEALLASMSDSVDGDDWQV